MYYIIRLRCLPSPEAPLLQARPAAPDAPFTLALYPLTFYPYTLLPLYPLLIPLPLLFYPYPFTLTLTLWPGHLVRKACMHACMRALVYMRALGGASTVIIARPCVGVGVATGATRIAAENVVTQCER